MRGLAIPIIGTMMIMVAIVVLFLYFNGTVFLERSTMEKGETALSLSHDVEMVRKMIEVSARPAAERAAYELGKDGGGYTEWNSTYPTIDVLQEMLEDRIVSRMSYDDMGLAGKRNLTIDIPRIEVDTTFPYCLEIDQSICFKVNGWQFFTITDDYISATATVNVTFGKTVDSTYMRLVYVAQQLAASTENDIMNGRNGKPGLSSLPDYTNIQSVTDIINNVTSELDKDFTSSWSGLTFEVLSSKWDTGYETATINWRITDSDSYAPVRHDETKICPMSPEGLDCLHMDFFVKVHA